MSPKQTLTIPVMVPNLIPSTADHVMTDDEAADYAHAQKVEQQAITKGRWTGQDKKRRRRAEQIRRLKQARNYKKPQPRFGSTKRTRSILRSTSKPVKKHYPGQHNQKDHGRRYGQKFDPYQDDPPEPIRSALRVDPEELLQSALYQWKGSPGQIATNMKRLINPEKYSWDEQQFPKSRWNIKVYEDRNMARVVLDALHWAPPSTGVLYRGDDFPGDFNRPQVGDIHNIPFAPATPRRQEAMKFADLSNAPGGHFAVLYKFPKGTNALPIERLRTFPEPDHSLTGLLEDEYLVTGKFRTTAVEEKGRLFEVTLEHVVEKHAQHDQSTHGNWARGHRRGYRGTPLYIGERTDRPHDLFGPFNYFTLDAESAKQYGDANLTYDLSSVNLYESPLWDDYHLPDVAVHAGLYGRAKEIAGGQTPTSLQIRDAFIEAGYDGLLLGETENWSRFPAQIVLWEGGDIRKHASPVHPGTGTGQDVHAGGLGPKPRQSEEWWTAVGEMEDAEEAGRLLDANRATVRAWEDRVRHALSMGQITEAEADDLGYRGDGDNWQPLPDTLYHVTTARTAVLAEGLKTRNEIGGKAKGLGGGSRDTISFTADPVIAEGIERAMREAHQVARGDITYENMIDEARRDGFLEDVMHYWDREWKLGDDFPPGVQNLIAGERIKHVPFEGNTTVKFTPDEIIEHRFDFYKTFAAFRERKTGRLDPLFWSSDSVGLSKIDPSEISTLTLKPKPGAQGYLMNALGEWRTGTGDAVEVVDST